MSKSKISFEIIQTGPIELTENLGSDPAYKIPIIINCSDKIVETSLEQITGTYYHASEGWVPCNDSDELSLFDVINGYDELQAELQRVLDDFGSTVLARLFRIAEALYDKKVIAKRAPAAVLMTSLIENDISLEPVSKSGKV
jgi:hypothetical protein